MESNSLEAGQPIGQKPRHKNVVREQLLKHAWTLYRNNLLSIPRFLECVCRIYPLLNVNQPISTIDEVDSYKDGKGIMQ